MDSSLIMGELYEKKGKKLLDYWPNLWKFREQIYRQRNKEMFKKAVKERNKYLKKSKK